MNALHKLLCLAAIPTLAAALPAQMGKRWIDEYSGTVYATRAPAIDSDAPDLQLWDLAGRPRSLHLERGRVVVLIAGSYT
ncbi:MAG: hypothetical protein H6835_06005 [Planctomycetes bacterium]|nr:hypothetical protein [Planctomycetota bacterium]